MTCTLCGSELTERAVLETECPHQACKAQLRACARCAKNIAGKFAVTAFGENLVRVALASRHGCPGQDHNHTSVGGFENCTRCNPVRDR